MRHYLTAAVLALSMFSSSALPQQAPATGSIEGMVVRGDMDQPIANAQVSLTALTAAELVPVITAADGKFAFRDLKPGTYRLNATTDSFIRMANGQRVANELGRLLFVEAGKSVTDVRIRIPATGTITGHIYDENGQPATGATVQLIRAIYNQQGRINQGAGVATVDDRGVYRIFAVPPGRYYRMAGTPPSAINLAGTRTATTRFSVTYYPGVSTLDEAMALEVKAGSESSVDLRSKRVTQLFHIRGRAINPAGTPFPPNTTAGLAFRQLGSFTIINRPNTFDPATGAFDLAGVPPGEFLVVIHPTALAQRGAGGPSLAEQQAMGLSASVPVHVTNADVDGLVIAVAVGVSVQGKLIVEGTPISAVPNLDKLELHMRIRAGSQNGLGQPSSSPIATDGSFQISGLRETEYLPQMNLSVPGFYLKSIKLGKQDILGTVFKFSNADSESFEVVLKAGTQTITGTVIDAQSQPVPGIAVVLIPAHRGRFDLFRSVSTDQTGKFTMKDLAPGEYKVFSWEAAENNAHLDPGYLKQYEELGKSVNVTESSSSSVDVKLIPAQ